MKKLFRQIETVKVKTCFVISPKGKLLSLNNELKTCRVHSSSKLITKNQGKEKLIFLCNQKEGEVLTV